ncbi:Sodium-dependent noradrenaline transporter [Blomia tropicalis]|nr:Sodium-dependent noradrenaline transporter [Blomia tropicalis]
MNDQFEFEEYQRKTNQRSLTGSEDQTSIVAKPNVHKCDQHCSIESRTFVNTGVQVNLQVSNDEPNKQTCSHRLRHETNSPFHHSYSNISSPNKNIGRFVINSDLDSLRSAPKINVNIDKLNVTSPIQTIEPSIINQSLPEEVEDDDDDDDDSFELNRLRDPIRRRISVTTSMNHSLTDTKNVKRRSNSETTQCAHVRRCQFRRYLFKWIPKSDQSESNKPKSINLQSIANDVDHDDELVEIKEEKLIVAKSFVQTEENRTSSGTTMIPEREEWGKKIDFLLSIIGFAVDLSNVWRFPYLCYKNGGGVFLIPYTIMLLFGALPLFFMELSLGQFAKSGPINIWDKICPPMKGIGYCFVLISWYVSFYYNVIIAWTINYVIKTLISGDLMPWQHCHNEYNTKSCISMDEIRQLCGGTSNESEMNKHNFTSSIECAKLSKRTSPTEEFFNLGLLQINKADGFSDMGVIRPELIGCLILVFIILYFSLFKGVKSSGKVVWVTATAPYFILTILLLRGLFLPGAISGIKYYINPRLEMLADPNVWVDAAVQVFYSIGVGFGVHLTYASFNKFNNNCYRDCLITASVNSLTSFYSGFVIFTYLGYMAHSMNKEIQNVASEGYGLVFQVYPEAISTLPFAKFWSILFFFMLLTLGIDSAMGGLEAVITGLMDEFKLHTWVKREVFTALVIFGSFVGALVNCTQGGAFTMVWFDTYSAGISLLCSAMFEALAVTYFYGVDRFSNDIQTMIGHEPNLYFIITWKYVSPIFLSVVIVMSILNSETLKYYGYDFPFWATFFGWCFTLSSISAVPIYAFIWFVRGKSFRPTKSTTTIPKDSLTLKNHYITGSDRTEMDLEMNNRGSNAAYV